MLPAICAGCNRRSCVLSPFKTLLILSFLLTLVASAQTDFTRIYGPEDQTVPMPIFVGSLGQKDARALQELIDYLKEVNITTWTGMQASGTLTDSSGNTSQATLTLLAGDYSRLDIETADGLSSTRIAGGTGAVQEANGKRLSMPPATAKAGLIAFPRLLSSAFPAPTASVLDRGQIPQDDR